MNGIADCQGSCQYKFIFLFQQVIRYCSVPDVSINESSIFIDNHVRHRALSEHCRFESSDFYETAVSSTAASVSSLILSGFRYTVSGRLQSRVARPFQRSGCSVLAVS